MKDTSLAAYEDLRPKLQQREQPIFDLLCLYPRGLSNSEIAKKLDVPVNEVTGRVNRMVGLGRLLDGGRKLNPRTGKLNHFWIVPGLQEQLELL